MSLPTLNEIFFPADADELASPEAVAKAKDEALEELKAELKKSLPGLSSKVVESEIASKIGEVLDVNLKEVLISAWKRYEGFQAYADPVLHPPEESALVPLAEHAIESSHEPRIDLKIKQLLVGSLGLNVQLSLVLEGVVLKIQAGRILAVCAGSCRASGTLGVLLTSKIGSKELLNLNRETPNLELPGAIELGEGVAIPRLAAEGEPRPEEPQRIA